MRRGVLPYADSVRGSSVQALTDARRQASHPGSHQTRTALARELLEMFYLVPAIEPGLGAETA